MNTPPITPMPVPGEAPAILLCGGVFDPPHRAHTGLPTLVRDAKFPGGWLLFVPAARSPFKGSPATRDADRLAMLALAIQGLDRAAIWTDELDRARPGGGEASYWIDTLERAKRSFAPRTRLAFLIGADQALEFHRWREPRRILELAEPAVLLRAPAETENQLADGLRKTGAWSDHEIDLWLARIVPAPLLDISATAVRAKLAAGAPDIPELDPAVLAYIRDNGLYGSPPRP